MSCRKNFRSDFHALFRFTDLQSEAFLGKHTAEQHFQSLEEKVTPSALEICDDK